MHAITKFVEEKLAPPLIRFSQLKYIQVMQQTGFGIMSLLIIGSLFLLVASFPNQAYLDFLGDFRMKIVAIAGIGTNFIGLFTVVTTSYALVDWYNKNKGEDNQIIQPVILAAACFLLLNPAQTVKTVVDGSSTPGAFTGIPSMFLGANGVFTALIVGILTVEIYRYFLNKKIVIRMPEGVPPMVANVFAGLIPSLFVVIFWWFIGTVLQINIPEVITDIFAPLIRVGDTPTAAMTLIALDRGLWSVGIHGANTLAPITGTFMTQMVAANQTAYAAGETLPHIFTSLFLDNYVWTGVIPLTLLLVISKKARFKGLGLLSLPGALFNIGEPIIFGLPVMMNPLMMIPFILSSLVLGGLASIGVLLNILPVPVLSIPWITPAPLKAFLSTGGSWIAVIFVLLGWAISILIFYPFVKALERQETVKEKISEGESEDEALDSFAASDTSQ